MKEIHERDFLKYGRLKPTHDFIGAIRFMESVPLPTEGLLRKESDSVNLETLKAYREMSEEYFAGLPLFIGYSVGSNSAAFPLRYHKSSTIFVAVSELSMGFSTQVEKNDSIMEMEWFRLPARTIIEVFGSVLFSSPVSLNDMPVRLIEAYVGIRDQKIDTNFEWECDPEVQLLVGMNTWMIARS